MKAVKRKSKKNWLNLIIPLVIYPFDVVVSIGESDEQLHCSLKRLGIAWDDRLKHEGAGRFALLPNNKGVLRVYRMPSSPSDYGTLAHEIFHAVEFICREMGMPLSDDSDEAYAYLIGYITTKVYKHLRPSGCN